MSRRAFAVPLVATVLIVVPGPMPRRRGDLSHLPRGINPNALAGRDPVRVARFDTLGTVASQREAHRVGAERLKSNVEYWKYSRPSVNLSSGSSFVTSTQRTDQFTFPVGGGAISPYARK